MKKLIAALLCVFLCIMSFATGVAEGSASYPQAYDAMLDRFERGIYTDAYTAAVQVYKANPAYKEIVNYYNYLTALQVHLPAGEYKEAYSIFQALSLRKFQKSEGYAAYALGCQYEADKDYVTALEQFSSAFANNVDEAWQKMQECLTKSNEEKYEQAAALERQKSYLAAAVAYEALVNDFPDARDKANECYYNAAENYCETGKYEEAADIFTKLRDYKDSAEKAIQNRLWASEGDDGNKLGLRMENHTSTSLILRWDDETALGQFTVTYMPAGIDSQKLTQTVNDTSVTLEGLLPNTQYTVSVSSPRNPSYSGKNNYWTEQASPVPEETARIQSIKLYQLDRSSVNKLGKALKVINTNNDGKTDKCIDITEDGYSPSGRKPSETNYDTYVCWAFFKDKSAASKQVEITYILRLDDKISVGKTEERRLDKEGFETITDNLTDLMDILYEDTGINGEEMTVDIYLNNQHMGTKTISLKK